MDEVVEAEATPEAPATEVIDAPEGDVGAVTEPVVDAGPDWGARVTEWGGEERVSDALAIAEALNSEEGIKALVREGLFALNLDPDAAFSLAAGEELPDPDALMTRAEFEAELKKRDQSFTEREQSRAEYIASNAVDSKLAELNVSDDVDRRMVLTYAQKYVNADEIDPARLTAAVEKGAADYEAVLVAKAEQRLKARAEKNSTVPSPLRGGGQPAGTEVEKPEGSKDFDAWKAAARKFLAQQTDQNP